MIERLASAAYGTAHNIWLAPLDQTRTIRDLLDDSTVYWPDSARGHLRIPIGLIDDPYYQRYQVLSLDISGSGGNALIVGGPQSGRSTALQTFIMAAAMLHRSSDIQFYCMDFGGGGKIAALADLSHVGAVATRASPDLAARMVADMLALSRKREKLFIQHNITGIADFRRRKANGDRAVAVDPYGDVVLVIDGWTTITKDSSANLEHLENDIITLAERGLSYGIHIVVASPRHADFKASLKDNCGSRVELRLNDPLNSEVDRKRASIIPEIPGRGITHIPGKRSVELPGGDVRDFLIALPLTNQELPSVSGQPITTDIDVNLQTSVSQLNVSNRISAPPVRLLPLDYQRSELVQRRSNEGFRPSSLPRQSGQANLVVPLGIGEAELEPLSIDFGVETHFLIFADSRSGKTTALRHIITSLVEVNTPDQVMVLLVDYRRGLLGVLPDESYGYHVSTEQDLVQKLTSLTAQLPRRLPSSDVTATQLQERSWWTGPDIFVVIDDCDQVVTHRSDPLMPLMEFIARGRDLGLHVILTHRTGGASRVIWGTSLVAELKALYSPGIVMSGSKDEGALLGTVKAAEQPPGRGVFVCREHVEVLQMPNMPAPR